jgi:hypothetical protein
MLCTQRKLSDKKLSERTYEIAVARRQLPENGLEELQKLVVSQLDLVRKIKERLKRGMKIVVDEDLYNRFMRLFYSAIYVFAVNGRIGGIESLRLKDVTLLFASAATTSEFKTQRFYKLQPVFFTRVPKYILPVYITVIRPSVEGLLKNPNNHLFLRSDGRPEANAGQKLTQFFREHGGLHITTNAIRTLVETETAAGVLNGTVSEAQASAVHRVNGHSSSMARKHYTLLTTKAVAAVSQTALDFDKHAPDFTDNQEVYAEPAPQYANWGTMHPKYGSKSKRIKFSSAELTYLRDLEEGFRDQTPNGELPSNLTSRCLKRIRDDPEALPIFHERHVLGADRLRAGLNTLKLVK